MSILRTRPDAASPGNASGGYMNLAKHAMRAGAARSRSGRGRSLRLGMFGWDMVEASRARRVSGAVGFWRRKHQALEFPAPLFAAARVRFVGPFFGPCLGSVFRPRFRLQNGEAQLLGFTVLKPESGPENGPCFGAASAPSARGSVRTMAVRLAGPPAAPARARGRRRGGWRAAPAALPDDPHVRSLSVVERRRRAPRPRGRLASVPRRPWRAGYLAAPARRAPRRPRV